MRVTTAAATMVAQVRFATGIRGTCQRPHDNRGHRSPGAGAGLEASRAKESCDQRGPERSSGTWQATSGGGFITLRPHRGCLRRTASSASVTGDEITYAPLAHLPRSIRRQRSLQKGKSASADFTGFLQIGQRSLMERLRGHRRLQKSEVRLQKSKLMSAPSGFHFCNLHL